MVALVLLFIILTWYPVKNLVDFFIFQVVGMEVFLTRVSVSQWVVCFLQNSFIEVLKEIPIVLHWKFLLVLIIRACFCRFCHFCETIFRVLEFTTRLKFFTHFIHFVLEILLGEILVQFYHCCFYYLAITKSGIFSYSSGVIFRLLAELSIRPHSTPLFLDLPALRIW